jgi:hypothetical protein
MLLVNEARADMRCHTYSRRRKRPSCCPRLGALANYLIELYSCKGGATDLVTSMRFTEHTVHELLRDSGLMEDFEECPEDEQHGVRAFELQGGLLPSFCNSRWVILRTL